MKTTVVVQENDDGELFLEFPYEVLQDVGFEVGDTLLWTSNYNGSFSITKKETEWVLVETIETFRMRYMVQVPKGKSAYALDTVTMEDAKEFSQKCLGETIASHRVVSKLEALSLCDEDNSYCSSWDDEQKLKAFFTTLAEQK